MYSVSEMIHVFSQYENMSRLWDQVYIQYSFSSCHISHQVALRVSYLYPCFGWIHVLPPGGSAWKLTSFPINYIITFISYFKPYRHAFLLFYLEQRFCLGFVISWTKNNCVVIVFGHNQGATWLPLGPKNKLQETRKWIMSLARSIIIEFMFKISCYLHY